MKLDISTLEIHILLKCNQGLLGRTDFTRLYRIHPGNERKAAIKKLVGKRICDGEKITNTKREANA